MLGFGSGDRKWENEGEEQKPVERTLRQSGTGEDVPTEETGGAGAVDHRAEV